MHEWRLRVEMKAMLEAGLSKSATAERLGVDRRTVSRWQEDRDMKTGRRRRGSKLDPYKGIIRERLTSYPELSAQRLFEECREAGYPGGYGRVRDYVRGLRQAPPAPSAVRFETPPGHQAQVDFGTFRTPWGGRHALVVVLGHSRMMWLEFFETQTMATVMTGLERAFGFFGGVPAELLFDQMKAVVTSDGRAVGGALVLNEEFGRFAAHWGFRIRACRPYRAQTKGKVERSIRYVRTGFFYGRQFLHDADLNEQVQRWYRDTANTRRCAALGESPLACFERVERGCLGPLAPRPFREDEAVPTAPSATRSIEVVRRSLTEYAEMTR